MELPKLFISIITFAVIFVVAFAIGTIANIDFCLVFFVLHLTLTLIAMGIKLGESDEDAGYTVALSLFRVLIRIAISSFVSNIFSFDFFKTYTIISIII